MKFNSRLSRWFLFSVLFLIPTLLFVSCQAVEKEPLNETAELNLAENAGGAYPILFATQIPIRPDFNTIGSTFANHMPSMQQTARGGDLYIRYPNGALKNLTQLAGYGSAGEFQDDDSIAVRDPAVHWDGNKALFSMVIGAPEERYQ
jgi:hypothetical protein